ncbi:universal stress protein [Bosea sp. 2KB_26]|uniref:universal stress protein n=1 Tax=Bosea sp. 2KB_26 TaxID=3237475 RepID=UPI003F909166
MTPAVPNVGSLRRILVATDLSTRSDRALRRATFIAKRLGSSLWLVHVVDGDLPHRMIEAERSAAMAVLEDTVRTTCEADGVSANFGVVVDDTFNGILSAANEFGADLLVLGPHRSRFRDVFTGTTVERVVRRSRIPVLVAIQPPSTAYERTLLALDFDDASKAAARGALRMGIFDKSAVKIMHAFDAPALGLMKRSIMDPVAIDEYVAKERVDAIERLEAYTKELGIPPTPSGVVLREGSPAQSILDGARAERSDLIVLGTSKKSGAKRVVIGSVAEQVLRDAERDILIIPVDSNVDGASTAASQTRDPLDKAAGDRELRGQ